MRHSTFRVNWLATYVVLVALFLILPELVAIIVSFNPTSRMVMSWTAVSGRWYQSLWQHEEYFRAFLLSFAIAPCVTVASLLLGGTAAYGVARLPSRSATTLQGLFVAPLVVPAAALAVALFLLLDRLRLTDTLTGVLIGHIVATLPYTFRTLLVALQSADRALEEAALSLGASRLAVVRRVTLPLIRPALVASALFALIISIDEFTLTWFISGRSIHTIPLEIFNNTQYGMDPTVAAASTVLIAASAVVIILLEKLVGLKTAYAVRPR
jgi:putative spermidine/putrescine transport system permease protein